MRREPTNFGKCTGYELGQEGARPRSFGKRTKQAEPSKFNLRHARNRRHAPPPHDSKFYAPPRQKPFPRKIQTFARSRLKSLASPTLHLQKMSCQIDSPCQTGIEIFNSPILQTQTKPISRPSVPFVS